MYFNKNHIILIILLILLFYFVNKYINNLFESFSICGTDSNNTENQNNKNKVTKNIITGFDDNGNPIEEEMNFYLACAGKDEKCLVDSEGDNTCCDKNLKCIRKIGNFQYKVCSDLKDACDINYNIYLRIFSGYYWNKLMSLIKDEEKSKYEETKKNVDDKVRNLCEGKQLNGDIFNQVVKTYLEELFIESEIFAEIMVTIALL
tara:strand:- start:113 stop:724 length:612 start_codon:yes stop_codon:yes gene_type:complete